MLRQYFPYVLPTVCAMGIVIRARVLVRSDNNPAPTTTVRVARATRSTVGARRSIRTRSAARTGYSFTPLPHDGAATGGRLCPARPPPPPAPSSPPAPSRRAGRRPRDHPRFATHPVAILGAARTQLRDTE